MKSLGYIQGDISRPRSSSALVCPSDTDPRRSPEKPDGDTNQCYFSYRLNMFLGGNYCAPGGTSWNGMWMNVSNWGHPKIAKKPSQTPMFVDCDNYRKDGARYGLFSYKSVSLDPGDPGNWILHSDTTQKNPGNAGARHNGAISTCFADGHAKLIMTPIPNSHTTDMHLGWANPMTLDRTDLN